VLVKHAEADIIGEPVKMMEILMKKLLGLLLVVTTGFAPVVGYTIENQTKGVGMVTVKMETSMGEITLELDGNKAPDTVANFVEYANAGFYDGTIFHRVIAGFMIQGGGFDDSMSQKKTSAPIRNEADNGLKNDTGTIAMARTSDPNSATAQFFINVKDNGFLNHTAPTAQGWGYAVFGKVTDGIDVVHAIEKVGTTTRSGMQDVPSETVTINKVTVQ
jgi:peptidyl-prolyl cis-trans isomerase B (cyclophilin B)